MGEGGGGKNTSDVYFVQCTHTCTHSPFPPSFPPSLFFLPPPFLPPLPSPLPSPVPPSQNRAQLLTRAGEMGAHGGHLLAIAGDTEVDPKIQEALVAMAKGVASATAALVTNAR